MRRYLSAFLLLLVGAVSVCFMHATPASALSYDTSNLIDNAVYYNKSSMTQNQIQNFINAFPSSCLLPQNYPSGLGQITFKEPLDYFTYSSSDVSPARIIWDASQYYSINPQVLLVTLEKEQNLVTGNAGCAVWKYNSAMGYNCPDGSENALKDYPNSGVYRTCVAKENNAGFARQVNHAAWQLSFDGKRSTGDLGWMGDGDTPYYGRMTQGWRAQANGAAAVYYDGYTTIDGQSVYLSNGPTAALYNYTPHFNNFNPIFTSWFGSPTGSVNVISPLSVTSDFSQGLFTKNTVRAQFTLRNTTGQQQDLGTMAIGVRDANGVNYDFGSQRIVLDAGQQYTFAATRTFDTEGSYTFNIIDYRDGYGWSESYPDSTNGYPRVVANAIVQNMPTVIAGPTVDNASLHTNEPTTMRFAVKNNSIYSVNLGYMGLAMSSPSGKNADLQFDTVNSLAPGATYNYAKSFTPTETGIYSARVSSTGDGGLTWSETLYPAAVSPANNRVSVAVKSSPTLTQGMSVTQSGAYAGDTVTGTFAVKNFSNVAVTVNKKLCYIIRGPSNSNYDLGCLDITTLNPGQTLTYSGARTMPVAGQYSGFFAMYDGTNWYNNWTFEKETGTEPTTTSFTVKDNPTIIQGLTLDNSTPRVGDTITGSFQVKNNSLKPVVVDKSLCYIVRGPNNTNYDLGCLPIGTMNTGQTLTFSASRKITDAGQYNGFFAMYDGANWHNNWSFAKATGAELSTLQFAAKGTPTLTQGLAISNPTPTVGSMVTGTFKIKNNSTSPAVVNKKLCYIVRGPSNTNNDFGCLDINTISPGQELTFTGSRVLALKGQYTGFFAMYDGTYWYNNWTFDKETGVEPITISFSAQ